jgi:pseudoazurin
MKYTKTLLMSAVLTTSVLLSSAAYAENHVIKAVGMKYKPLVVKIAPGDTVSWEDMSIHLVETIEGMIPEGAEGFVSKLGDAFQTQPLTVEGAYFYKCTPHWGARMGGVIIVGNPTNLEAITASKPKGALKYFVKKANKAMQ